MTSVDSETLPDVIDFFEGVENDLTKVTWGHGINDEKSLENAIQDESIMMLEADVSDGTLSYDSSSNSLPIMAHPPDKTSDLSLNDWILKVVKANKEGMKKGAKLDFKDLTIVSNSLEILAKYQSSINFPLWLNADIIEGPGSTRKPVDSDIFLSLCREFFPTATLSVGWTTGFDATKPDQQYTTDMMESMVHAIEKNNIDQPITFPVRAAFVSKSQEELYSLSGRVVNSTFTVWSSATDEVDMEGLYKFVDEIGVEDVYIDLPKNQNIEFEEIKKASNPDSGSVSIFPSQTAFYATAAVVASSLAALYFSD